jgi:hypothetical protein
VNLRLKPKCVVELTQTLDQGVPGYKQVFKALAVISLCGVLAAPIVQAQSDRLVVNIPFQFNVGKAVLPSGKYGIKLVNPTTLMIQSKDGHQSALATTIGVSAPKGEDTGKLVFNRYGTQYFLSKLWAAENPTGRELLMSRTEIEIAKSISRHEATVAVKTP